MINTNLAGASDIDLLHRRATELVAHSPRVRRTDGISWLQRHLKIDHQQAIRVMEGLVASGKMIRVPEVAGYSYLKAGDDEVSRACKVMVLSNPAMTASALLTKWRLLLLGLGEIELEVDVIPVSDRGTIEFSDVPSCMEWDYLIVDAPGPEVAPF